MHPLGLTTFLVVFTSIFVLSLWLYWAIVFPVIRKEMGFRIERGLNLLKLLAIEGKIKPGTALYARASTFLEESREASENLVGIRFIADQSVIRKRTVELRALMMEMDEADPIVRVMVENNLNLLVGLWIAQRPALIFIFAILAPMSYFIGAAKKEMERGKFNTPPPIWRTLDKTMHSLRGDYDFQIMCDPLPKSAHRRVERLVLLPCSDQPIQVSMPNERRRFCASANSSSHVASCATCGAGNRSMAARSR